MSFFLFILALLFALVSTHPSAGTRSSLMISENVNITIGVESTTDDTSAYDWAGPVIRDVVVGAQDKLIFSPNNITANIGDIVRFHFLALNHSVFLSSFDQPCTSAGGFGTGFGQFNPSNTSGILTSFSVNTLDPQFFFCSQTKPSSHCHAGMVFAINAGNNVSQFLMNAGQANASSPTTSSMTPMGTNTALTTNVTDNSTWVTSAFLLPGILSSSVDFTATLVQTIVSEALTLPMTVTASGQAVNFPSPPVSVSGTGTATLQSVPEPSSPVNTMPTMIKTSSVVADGPVTTPMVVSTASSLSFVFTTITSGKASATTTMLSPPTQSQPGVMEVIEPEGFITIYITSGTASTPVTQTIAVPSNGGPGVLEVVSPGAYSMTTVTSNTSGTVVTTLAQPQGTVAGTIEFIAPYPWTNSTTAIVPVSSLTAPTASSVQTSSASTAGEIVGTSQARTSAPSTPTPTTGGFLDSSEVVTSGASLFRRGLRGNTWTIIWSLMSEPSTMVVAIALTAVEMVFWLTL